MRLAIPLLVLLAGTAIVAGEDPLPYQIEFDQHGPVRLSNRSDSGIHVTVQFRVKRNSDGKLVRDIRKDDIVVQEDGRRVSDLEFHAPETAGPLTAVLGIDISGSMAEHGKLTEAKQAAGLFLDRLSEQADCGLILFDHQLHEPLPPAGDPSRVADQRRLVRARIEAARPGGGTAWIDATARAIEMLRDTPGRRAVVLLTDGVDLNSRHTLSEVTKMAQVAGVPVYTLGVGEPGKGETVTSVLVLDRSGSMDQRAGDHSKISKIEALHQAASRFVELMRPGAQTTLLPFSSRVATPRPFSADKNALKADIEKLKARGGTALFDAAYTAIETLEAAAPAGKRAVVVLTDGEDESSRRRDDEVIARARQTGTPVYMLGLGRTGELDEAVMRKIAESTGGSYHHSGDEESLIRIFEDLSIQIHDDGIDEASLKRLADETGGKYKAARQVSELPLIYQDIADEIQSTYTVTFASHRPEHDGTARGIEILLMRGGVPVSAVASADYQVHGVVVPEMNAAVYLGLLAMLGGLLAVPRAFRRISKPASALSDMPPGR
jgi:VWFA-related protein